SSDLLGIVIKDQQIWFYVFQASDNMAVNLAPFGIEVMQDSCGFFFVCLLMHLFEFVHDLFTIVDAYFSADIAHDMNQTALKMSFRISSGQCCFHANNTIRKKNLNLLSASGFLLLKHKWPVFNVRSRRNAVVNVLIVPIRLDANGYIDCFTLKCFSAQRLVCRIQIDAEYLVA